MRWQCMVDNEQTNSFATLEQSAKQGDAQAQFQLGLLYFKGDEVQQDYKQAKDWFEKAAVQGHVEAQWLLGVMYDRGIGTQQDYEQAKYCELCDRVPFLVHRHPLSFTHQS